MNRSFTRKLDALHLTHVVEADPDPATMSLRDRAIRYWKKWDLCVATPDGDKRAHELTEADWAVIIYSPGSKEWMTFHMPGTPTFAEERAALQPVIAPAAPAESSQPKPPAPAPPPPPAPPRPPPLPPPVEFVGGLCRWVPRHEADAMRAQDMRDYQRRLAEEKRRRFLGWD